DAEHFKRWARRQQIPTQFWYSGYPTLTTSQIRRNAKIRHGFAVAESEDEARNWLLLFGSTLRPAPTLQTSEIQSLILGGLGFLPEGLGLTVNLCSELESCKAWLADILPHVAFADGRALSDAIFIALAPSGLRKLGLDEAAVATFPPAFVDGMTAPWRARIL